MTIDDLIEDFDEDSEAHILRVEQVESGVVFRIRMDCLIHSDVAREFEILALDVIEVEPKIGWFGNLDLHDDHPLTWDHSHPWLDLYYTAAPVSGEDVIGRLYEAHESVLQGWRPLSKYLNATSAQLIRGNGLLASGPQPLINNYSQSLTDLVRTNTVLSRRSQKAVKVLILGDAFAVCSNVSLTEISDNRN